VKAFAGGR